MCIQKLTQFVHLVITGVRVINFFIWDNLELNFYTAHIYCSLQAFEQFSKTWVENKANAKALL